MRDYVMNSEISAILEVADAFRQGNKKPKITLCVVNKRVGQKFSTLDGMNLAQGTVVDKGLVNKEEERMTYDFFLVSQNCTQGTATPTHYFVHYDDSKLPKQDFEQLTYNLCYAYQNWPGAIKVPAPCMYAHKFAEFSLQTKVVGKKTAAIANPT